MQYIADEGKVWDWADMTLHKHWDEEKQEYVYDHLYCKIINIPNETILNEFIQVNIFM